MTLINSQTELTRFTVTVEGRTVCEVTVIQQERTEWRGECGDIIYGTRTRTYFCVSRRPKGRKTMHFKPRKLEKTCTLVRRNCKNSHRMTIS